MKSKVTNYQLLYETLVPFFYSGIWKKGDLLPSLSNLCQTYNVSTKTAKRALQELEKNGFVCLSQGKRAESLYGSPEQYLENLYLKKDALIETYRSFVYLLPPFMVQGAWLCEKDDILYLRSLLQMQSIDGSQKANFTILISRFIHHLIDLIQNPIITNLYQAIELFCSIPHIPERSIEIFPYEKWNRDIKHAITYIEKRDLHCFRFCIEDLFNEIAQNTDRFLQKCPTYNCDKNKISFHWRPTGESLYTELTLLLLERIDKGIYQEGQYLPGIREMSLLYGVSEITVRGTIKILNQIGIAETVNGKGTVITLNRAKESPLTIKNPVVKKSILSFLYTLQAILLLCSKVAENTCSVIPEEAIRSMGNWLENGSEEEVYRDAISAFFLLVSRFAPTPVLQSILEELYDMERYGYFMVFCHHMEYRKSLRLHQNRVIFKSLLDKNTFGFGKNLQNGFLMTMESVKENLILSGMTEAININCSYLLYQ